MEYVGLWAVNLAWLRSVSSWPVNPNQFSLLCGICDGHEVLGLVSHLRDTLTGDATISPVFPTCFYWLCPKKMRFFLGLGSLYVIITRSGSGFPSNATLVWIFYLVTATCCCVRRKPRTWPSTRNRMQTTNFKVIITVEHCWTWMWIYIYKYVRTCCILTIINIKLTMACGSLYDCFPGISPLMLGSRTEFISSPLEGGRRAYFRNLVFVYRSRRCPMFCRKSLIGGQICVAQFSLILVGCVFYSALRPSRVTALALVLDPCFHESCISIAPSYSCDPLDASRTQS
jgi:hypothetical protein